MELYGKSITMFPEFHLSDFPPQIVYTQEKVVDVIKTMNILNTDLFIVGYIESFEDKLYSSCLISDNGKVYNIRKKYLQKTEIDILSCGDPKFKIIPLSIGDSYFFMCNDITIELESEEFINFVNRYSIKNFFLISAMGINFDRWTTKLSVAAKDFRIKNILLSDRFNGISMLNT